MKVIISPAKRLDFETKSPITQFTYPVFVDEAYELIQILRGKSIEEIKSLMKISLQLAQLNYERYIMWNPTNSQHTKQAIFAFEGDVFKALQKHTLNADDFSFLQDNLFILSGLYGVLKPFDLIEPHRLEGGTKLENDKGKNLYDFWGSKITDYINSHLAADDTLVNLASNEYFKYIKKKELNAKIINLNFKELKNGQLKTIAIYAKQARGKMLHYIAKNKIENPLELQNFNYDNYKFSPENSTNQNYVFMR